MLDKEGFANRLRSTRESLKLKQEDVAARLGVGRTGYAAYESGKSVPPLESIMILLDILNVSFDWLTKGEESKAQYSLSQIDENSNAREIEMKYMKALEEIISLKDQLLEKKEGEKKQAQAQSQKL